MPCPICGRSFALEDIVEHADICAARLERASKPPGKRQRAWGHDSRHSAHCTCTCACHAHAHAQSPCPYPCPCPCPYAHAHVATLCGSSRHRRDPAPANLAFVYDRWAVQQLGLNALFAAAHAATRLSSTGLPPWARNEERGPPRRSDACRGSPRPLRSTAGASRSAPRPAWMRWDGASTGSGRGSTRASWSTSSRAWSSAARAAPSSVAARTCPRRRRCACPRAASGRRRRARCRWTTGGANGRAGHRPSR